MKILSFLFLSIFLGKGCNGESKQDIDAAVLEYVANTRGFYLNILIQNKAVVISKDRNGNDKSLPVKISEADQKELLAAFEEVKLEELPNLKAPTEKRFYDGAAIASLKVTYKGKTYESVNFDHGNPPAEIQKLVTKMNSFAKKDQ